MWFSGTSLSSPLCVLDCVGGRGEGGVCAFSVIIGFALRRRGCIASILCSLYFCGSLLPQPEPRTIRHLKRLDLTAHKGTQRNAKENEDELRLFSSFLFLRPFRGLAGPRYLHRNGTFLSMRYVFLRCKGFSGHWTGLFHWTAAFLVFLPAHE